VYIFSLVLLKKIVSHLYQQHQWFLAELAVLSQTVVVSKKEKQPQQQEHQVKLRLPLNSQKSQQQSRNPGKK
jgi:hypothetical protein